MSAEKNVKDSKKPQSNTVGKATSNEILGPAVPRIVPIMDLSSFSPRISGCSVRDVEFWRKRVWNDRDGVELTVNIIDPSPRLSHPLTPYQSNRILKRSILSAKVLSAHSPYFAAMLSRNAWRESRELKIEFSATDVPIKTWEHFMYSLQPMAFPSEGLNPLIEHVGLRRYIRSFFRLTGNFEPFIPCLLMKISDECRIPSADYSSPTDAALIDLYVFADYLLDAPLKNCIIDHFHKKECMLNIDRLASIYSMLEGRTPESDNFVC